MGVFSATRTWVNCQVYPAAPDYLFEPDAWPRRLGRAGAGRGSAWHVGDEAGEFVLRRYRRGGLIGRLVSAHYVALGARFSRSYREWALLRELQRRDLPVPEPIGARYRRRGLLYQATLVTRLVADAQTLAERLTEAPLPATDWQRLGALLRRFHDAGVYHADLNAHNILVNGAGAFYLIDFDRGRLRAPGSWRRRNLARLLRSFEKLGQQSTRWHADDAGWQALMAGYGDESLVRA